ncbi:MAG TPA: cyclic nucleotide-binding domain-containing protein, partial [Caldilineaceae bacterium]|nr:cyclic nucleotide-binding domain-containing protein [Caldilineaceae bacterium]
RRTCRAGEVLLTEGEPAEALFVITVGRVALYKQLKGGLLWPLLTLEPGQWVGALPLLTGLPAPFTAKAAGACQLIELPRPAVERVIAAHPELIEMLRQTVQAHEEALAQRLDQQSGPLRQVIRRYLAALRETERRTAR